MERVARDWRVLLDPEVVEAIRELEERCAWLIIAEPGNPPQHPKAWFEMPVPALAIKRLELLRSGPRSPSLLEHWLRWEIENPVECARLTVAIAAVDRRPYRLSGDTAFMATEAIGDIAPQLDPNPYDNPYFFKVLDPEDRSGLDNKSIKTLRLLRPEGWSKTLWPRSYREPQWGEVAMQIEKKWGIQTTAANVSGAVSWLRRKIERFQADRLSAENRERFNRALDDWNRQAAGH